MEAVTEQSVGAAALMVEMYESRDRVRALVEAPDAPRLTQEEFCTVLDEFRQAGLSFLDLANCTDEQLYRRIESLEAAAGGPEAFARSLRRPPGWTWRT